MSVRNQAGQAPMSSTMGREEERAAHGDPRKGSAAIAVTAVGMAVLILAAAFAAGRRSSPRSTTSVAAAAQAGGPSAAIGSSRLRMAVRWVDGLAAGLILPSDVTSRLDAQDPKIAEVFTAAWADLNPVAI